MGIIPVKSGEKREQSMSELRRNKKVGGSSKDSSQQGILPLAERVILFKEDIFPKWEGMRPFNLL